MSHRLHLEARRVADRVEHGDPYWPAQGALLLAAALNLLVSERVSPGPRWVVSLAEVAAVVVVMILRPARATSQQPRLRIFALGVFGIVALTNIVSLGFLVHFLVNGGQVAGRPLVTSGMVLWVNNVLLFSVVYWELDRGGPVLRFQHPGSLADLSFPQMQNPELAPPNWQPGYLDYLYTSFTAATAFSPTDTMPLTHTAKILMAIQSAAAFATIGLVIARAVNILG